MRSSRPRAQRGVRVSADQYPYVASSTSLTATIPDWAEEGGTAKLIERLKDPATRAKIRREMEDPNPTWENRYQSAGTWQNIQLAAIGRTRGVADTNKIAEPQVRGDAHRRSGEARRQGSVRLRLRSPVEERGSVGCVYFIIAEDDLTLALKQPWVAIGSDGSALATEGPLRSGVPHPRSFGTFPRVLGRYVRELKVISLEDAIRKMTSLPAAHSEADRSRHDCAGQDGRSRALRSGHASPIAPPSRIPSSIPSASTPSSSTAKWCSTRARTPAGGRDACCGGPMRQERLPKPACSGAAPIHHVPSLARAFPFEDIREGRPSIRQAVRPRQEAHSRRRQFAGPRLQGRRRHAALHRRASGARITDIDGNTFIDYVGSWGPMIHGHAPSGLAAALARQARLGTSFGAPSPLEVELAELVQRLVPSMERVRFVSSGTEATMSAARVARGATGRDKIIKFEGCYHGHADAFLVQAGSGALTFGTPTSPGVPAAAVAATLLARFNDLASVEKLTAANPGQIAAVIVEPVAGNMGTVRPNRVFSQACARSAIARACCSSSTR